MWYETGIFLWRGINDGLLQAGLQGLLSREVDPNHTNLHLRVVVEHTRARGVSHIVRLALPVRQRDKDASVLDGKAELLGIGDEVLPVAERPHAQSTREVVETILFGGRLDVPEHPDFWETVTGLADHVGKTTSLKWKDHEGTVVVVVPEVSISNAHMSSLRISGQLRALLHGHLLMVALSLRSPRWEFPVIAPQKTKDYTTFNKFCQEIT